MTDVRVKRDGSWVVELTSPLQHSGKQLDEIRIRALTMGQLVRWNKQEIPSVLALLSELSDLPEMLLRQVTFPDVDRLMLAFASMMPPVIQQAMTQQTRPMATPDELLPQYPQGAPPINDQIDPRFPHVDGPVRRFPTPPVINVPGQAPPEAEVGIAQPPEIMKAV